MSIEHLTLTITVDRAAPDGARLKAVYATGSGHDGFKDLLPKSGRAHKKATEIEALYWLTKSDDKEES